MNESELMKSIRTAASASERARIGSILECEEAAGRESLARFVAFQTDLDVSVARKILGASPIGKARLSPFEEHLAALKGSYVGVGSGDEIGDVGDAIASTVKLFHEGGYVTLGTEIDALEDGSSAK